jgi:hypothetical protein
VGGQCHASAVLPPGKNLGTHCIGDWVGPRAGLDMDRIGGKMYLWKIYCATAKGTSIDFSQGLYFIPGVYKITGKLFFIKL